MGDPDDRERRNGLGNSSVQGVRYVTHKVSSGKRLAVLSVGHCVKASHRKRYSGFWSISLARSTSSIESRSLSAGEGVRRADPRAKGVLLPPDAGGERGDNRSPSAVTLPVVFFFAPPSSDVSANKYVVNRETALTRSSLGGL